MDTEKAFSFLNGYEVKDRKAREEIEKMLLNGPAIVTGSYSGTSAYGEENPVVLNFGFKPKFIFICKTGDYSLSFWVEGKTTLSSFLYYSSEVPVYAAMGYVNVDATDNGVSLWTKDGYTTNLKPFNHTGDTYYYYAIGYGESAEDEGPVLEGETQTVILNINDEYGGTSTQTHTVDSGATWLDLVAQVLPEYTETGQYGVGATTGRIYWYIGAGIAGYVQDGDGNYMMGDDVIVSGTYTVDYVGYVPLD